MDITSLFAEGNVKFLTVLCGKGSAVCGAGQSPGSWRMHCAVHSAYFRQRRIWKTDFRHETALKKCNMLVSH